MRAGAAAVLVIAAGAACRGGSRGPAAPAVEQRRDVCAGLDAEACQDRLIVQSLCLQQPDGGGCEALRAEGLLPPAPPPLEELLGCWAVEDARDDRPTAWICVGGGDVAIEGLGGWDVWPHGGWKREDTARRAGWVAERADAPSLWLTVVQAETPPRPGDVVTLADGTKLDALDRPARAAGDRTVLHLADGTGALSARLVADDPGSARDVTARRAALPAASAVCAAARACLAAVPRPPPPSEIAMEIEVEAEPDPLAGVETLRGCYGVWRAAVDRLDHAVERADLPPACAIAPVTDDAWDAWATPLRPPFAPLDAAAR